MVVQPVKRLVQHWTSLAWYVRLLRWKYASVSMDMQGIQMEFALKLTQNNVRASAWWNNYPLRQRHLKVIFNANQQFEMLLYLVI